MRNKKGFTLIEIMIVIAIIGILAIVLIPRIGAMRDSAKMAGVDTNMRVAEGVAQKLLNDYTPATTGVVGKYESDLAAKLYVKDAEKDAANPLTSITGADTTTNVISNGGAFAYASTDDSDGSANAATGSIYSDLKTTLGTGNAALKGVIYYGCFIDSATKELKVTLIPIDQNGVAMPEKQVTLTK